MFMLAVSGFEDLHVHQDCDIIAFVTCVHTVGGNHFRGIDLSNGYYYHFVGH